MIETSAPGKLFVAGEYAVVEPGEPAILIAVDRFLTVRLAESRDAGHVHSGEYGAAPLVWRLGTDGVSVLLEHRPHDYLMSAIGVIERLRAERGLTARYFDLHVASQLDDEHGNKFGLGSSAAVTVAVVAALNEFYGLGLSPLERYRVAMLATIAISPNASGGDVASSTFGGWIRYSSPDRARLLYDLRLGVETALTSIGWEPSSITPIPQPHHLRVLVGWTGSPASTERLVDGVRHGRDTTSPSYAEFLRDSARAVDALTSALQSDDAPAAQTALTAARTTLQRLGALTGIVIETDALRALCDSASAFGAAGKPSGAGGGDCGIVLATEQTDVDALRAAWIGSAIRPLDVAVHESVVSEEVGRGN